MANNFDSLPKIKTKEITLANNNRHKNAINQSQLEENTYIQC